MRCVTVAVCAGSLVMVAGAFAQNASPQAGSPASASAPELVEIVVTAQRREQRLIDVPISASVVSGADLEKNNINTLEDLSSRLPNVKITDGIVPSLDIRGLGSGPNQGFEQSVGTFVDGVYRGRAISIKASLFDVDQVEVLKGPQSTFFGNNAIAGALNITTRKPGDQFAVNGSVLGGVGDGEFAVEGGVDMPITDTLSVRLAGKYYGEKGFVDNSFNDSWGPQERNDIARVSVRWHPNDNWETNFRVDNGNYNTWGMPSELTGCPPPAVFGPPTPTCVAQTKIANAQQQTIDYNAADNETTSDFFRLTETALTNRLTLGAFTIHSITAYYEHSDDFAPVTGGLAVPGVAGGAYAASSYAERYHQFSEELRVDSSVGILDYDFGGYYATDRVLDNDVLGFYFAPFGLFAGPPYGPATPVDELLPFSQDSTTYSGFASGTLHLTDAFRLNGGLRYTTVRKTAYGTSLFGEGGGLPGQYPSLGSFVLGSPSVNTNLAGVFGADPANFTNPSRKDSKLMPSVSLQYDIAHDVMTYVSFTEGFKAGGYGVGNTRNTFNPEYVDAYEIGLKGNFFDRKLSLTSAIFYSRYRDLQEATNVVLADGLALSEITNIGVARTEGIELGMTYQALSMLAFNADVAYTEATNISYPNAPCTQLQSAQVPFGTACPPQNLSGQVLPYAPKWSGNVGATLGLPVPGQWYLNVVPTVYFTSGYFEANNLDPTQYQSDYVKLDTRISFGPSSHHWELALIGKNLTDKGTASIRSTVVGTPGSVLGWDEPPRVVALQFSFNWK